MARRETEIIVKINRDTLDIETEVVGMEGKGCRSLLDSFQKVIKMAKRSERLKPEFHRKAKTKIAQRR